MKFYDTVKDVLTEWMNQLADFIGKPQVFVVVVVLVACWGVTRIFIDYDTWFDVIDFFIFVSTFFLLFVVQASQNADTRAIQDKLDALIKAVPGADGSKEREEKIFKKKDVK